MMISHSVHMELRLLSLSSSSSSSLPMWVLYAKFNYYCYYRYKSTHLFIPSWLCFACTSANREEKSPSKSWTVDDRIDLFTCVILVCSNDVMPRRNLRFTLLTCLFFAVCLHHSRTSPSNSFCRFLMWMKFLQQQSTHAHQHGLGHWQMFEFIISLPASPTRVIVLWCGHKI